LNILINGDLFHLNLLGKHMFCGVTRELTERKEKIAYPEI